MKIKAITPIRVGEAELLRRRKRYQSLSPPGVEIDLVDLPEEAPQSLESEEDIRDSERFVIEAAMNTKPSEHDAVLPDCVLDPGLDALERDCPVPAFGILKLASGFLRALGHRFASVTRNSPIGEELRRRLEVYGFTDSFERNVILDLSFDDIADDARWNAALEEAGAQFVASETTAIINGCSAVEVKVEGDVSMVDPTALALRVLGIVADTGLPLRPENARSLR